MALSAAGAKRVVILCDSAFAGTPSRHSRIRVTPVPDPVKMLFACLSNVAPREANRIEFDGIIPPTFQQAAMLLYRVAADSEELKGLASQRICDAIETFLRIVMTEDEVKTFTQQNPLKTPIKRYSSILEEMGDN